MVRQYLMRNNENDMWSSEATMSYSIMSKVYPAWIILSKVNKYFRGYKSLTVKLLKPDCQKEGKRDVSHQLDYMPVFISYYGMYMSTSKRN